jgi:TPR repeat protein
MTRGTFEAALTFWLPLAEQGLAAAQLNLGALYEKGQGVSQDFAESARWYSKAAEQGLAGAQFSLAVLYEKGTGLPRDPKKARYWYDRALADPGTDPAALETKQRAQERIWNMTEEIVAYSGGRFWLRRAASGECVIALQAT